MLRWIGKLKLNVSINGSQQIGVASQEETPLVFAQAYVLNSLHEHEHIRHRKKPTAV